MHATTPKQKKERNLWPHAIVGAIIFIIVACGWTVKIALDNPVQFDQTYLAKYDQVDSSINELRANQQVFDGQFEAIFPLLKVEIDKPTQIPLQILRKVGALPVEEATVTLLITRPDTNAFNQEPHVSKGENGMFFFGPVVLDKPGRWQLLSKIQIDEFEGFVTHEVFASK
ncbi:FixH family protein [Sulfurospirillum sp. T05]|uniref:FixH family protein n=1 Tax=Sulfurospirillum tamanense TaxID=2813362 RepID=A0ABS2WNG6_9BACT|nr:FixH family protein [Sulfurospirillum tamanensis]MBN2963221.1 FixH family protein [Sulfurospirillum tamanensis]